MHDAQIRVAIAGAGGRMGRQLIQAALQMEGVALGAALEREGSSLVGSDAGELAGAGKAGVAVQSSLAAVKDDFDVLIDFTRPEGTLNHLAFCREHGKKSVRLILTLISPKGEEKHFTADADADFLSGAFDAKGLSKIGLPTRSLRERSRLPKSSPRMRKISRILRTRRFRFATYVPVSAIS